MENIASAAGNEPAEQLSPPEQLRAMWLAALAEPNPEIDAGIDELINCDVVSVRYALLTQLRVVLTIAGEAGRAQFLTLVGEELNDRVTQPAHKLAWQGLLRNL